ncbi:MAG TPA: cytochrome c [Acidobacteriaceae bacterium]|nr:cytochrome c [Acidobacteriaceae bacterium]
MRSFVSFIVGLLVCPLVLFLYLSFGHLPVAVGDKPFPFENRIVKVPLAARIHREMPSTPPISATADNLNAGAQIYEDKCEFCHGTADSESSAGRSMFPSAPRLWLKRKNGVVGVSDDPVGETYWKVKNGIRLTGMPAYNKMLSDTEIWQVSLLLSVADKPLPADAAQMVGLAH